MYIANYISHNGLLTGWRNSNWPRTVNKHIIHHSHSVCLLYVLSLVYGCPEIYMRNNHWLGRCRGSLLPMLDLLPVMINKAGKKHSYRVNHTDGLIIIKCHSYLIVRLTLGNVLRKNVVHFTWVWEHTLGKFMKHFVIISFALFNSGYNWIYDYMLFWFTFCV